MHMNFTSHSNDITQMINLYTRTHTHIYQFIYIWKYNRHKDKAY